MKQHSLKNGKKYIFVFYDIKETKIRNKLIKSLEEVGLKRTQLSVFYDYHENSNLAILKRAIERSIGKEFFKQGRILITHSEPLESYGFSLEELENPFHEYL